MNREIKFRGLRTDGKGWVYGYYVYRPDGKHLIYWQPFDEASQNTYHEVLPETVGQFTGLLDKNGKEIFEGDVVIICTLENNPHGCIEWNETFGAYWINDNDKYTFGGESVCKLTAQSFEIIGNIHETNLTNQ
jgi:uncharacterized phage protein (TIGR01671 family)